MLKRIFLILVSVIIIAGCRTVKVVDVELEERARGWNADQFVELDSGWVEGREDIEKTWAWLGIPYAKPPIAELRWKAPRPVDPWSDVKPVFKFASPASQLKPIFTRSISGSEDCLYLNIWRPRTMEENLPVYVWVHGGGNSKGSPDLSDYYGHALASRSNAVFVSINYRLGPLGWFHHPALNTENVLDNSGNYGLLDIIAALKWIQRNIDAFGGDTQNVTLSGESAGANNTLALMLSPEAEGLFHQAIVQSGYKRSYSIEEAERQGAELADYLLEKRGLDSSDLSLEEVREVLLNSSASELFRFYNAGPTGMVDHIYHIEDGVVFPKNGWDAFTDGTYPNQVPLLIGSNKDEMKLFMYLDSSIPWDSELYDALAEIESLRVFKEDGVDSIAAGIKGNPGSPPVYAYRFDWGGLDSEGRSQLPGDWGRKLGAFHTLEIPFFLGTSTINGPIITSILFNRANAQSRSLLSAEIMNYSSNFIRGGNPNIGSPTAAVWPEWGTDNSYIIFNADSEKLKLATDNRIITADDRLKELELELSPDVYSQLLERVN